mmetsp:Transcript_11229/g.20753  ORF Transcript_11229/g.20753 Transcript_11229/m.20753 type:complete len:554 (-) Transcript_11229:27-1688(-)
MSSKSLWRQRLRQEDPKYGSKGRSPGFSSGLRILSLVLLVGIVTLASYVAITELASNGSDTQVNFGGAKVKMASSVRPKPKLREADSSSSGGNAGYVKELEGGGKIGYVRVPQIAKGERTEDDGKLHIIFSSGCNYFQHWQAELLLASAYLVGQRGRITRIVSGCYDQQAEKVAHRHQTFPSGKNDKLVPLDVLNRSVNENFGLFVTPTFEGAIDFPWINKPSSIQYFMEHARPELDRLGETVIVVLDPDFVFLQRLSQSTAQARDIIATRGHASLPGVNVPADVVIKGRPVAQRYGLEGGWVASKFDLEKITGERNSKASKWSSSEAGKWTSVGPPLMLHIDDIAELSVLWERYMHPVLDAEVDILADMWAYSIASAQLDLRHTILDHFMLSVWGNKGEAYDWVDKWSGLSCKNPKPGPGDKSPTFIHMAANYKAPDAKEGPWMFHKGHVPATILECDSPLIIEAPDDLYEITPNEKQLKQRAWFVCNIVSRLNKVVYMYKQKFCPKGFEERKLIRLVQHKTVDRGCSERRDKWCYPLAQIEGLPSNWRSSL